MAVKTWNAYQAYTPIFEFPFDGRPTGTWAYIYKVELNKDVLTLQVQARCVADGGSWSAIGDYYMSLDVNFYDKNGSFMGSVTGVPNHKVYNAYTRGNGKTLWDQGLGYNLNVYPDRLLPSSCVGLSYSALTSQLASMGCTPQFGSAWVSGEPFYYRFLTDDSSVKYPPRPISRMPYSYYRKDSSYGSYRPDPAPATITITVPRNAAAFNVTLKGNYPGDNKSITFPDVAYCLSDDNFILDPYTKGYIKYNNWNEEPYLWHYDKGGEGWHKIFGYIKDGTWKPI